MCADARVPPDARSGGCQGLARRGKDTSGKDAREQGMSEHRSFTSGRGSTRRRVSGTLARVPLFRSAATAVSTRSPAGSEGVHAHMC